MSDCITNRDPGYLRAHADIEHEHEHEHEFDLADAADVKRLRMESIKRRIYCTRTALFALHEQLRAVSNDEEPQPLSEPCLPEYFRSA